MDKNKDQEVVMTNNFLNGEKTLKIETIQKEEGLVDMRELDAISPKNNVDLSSMFQMQQKEEKDVFAQNKWTQEFKDTKLEDKFLEYIYGRKTVRLHLIQWIFTVLNLLFFVNDYMSFSEYITSNWTTITVFAIRAISFHFYIFYFLLVIPSRIRSWINSTHVIKAIKIHEVVYIYSVITTVMCVGIMSVMTTSVTLSSFPTGYVACAYSAFMVSHVRIPGLVIIYAFLASFRLIIAGIWFGVGLERYSPTSPFERISWHRVIIYEFTVLVITTLAFVEAFYIHGYLRRSFIDSETLQRQHALLENKKKKSLKLLANILPVHFVDKVTINESRFMQYFQDVTVLFSDLKSFTSFSSTVTAEQLIHILNAQFMEFDMLAEAYQLEKIKTIGDAYFCIGGIRPHEQKQPENHVSRILSHHALRSVKMGQAMINHLNQLNEKHGWSFEMRVGVARAPAVVCVLGQHLITFDVLGEAPIQAEDMESSGRPGYVHITASVAEIVESYFELEQLSDDTYIVNPSLKMPLQESITLINSKRDEDEVDSLTTTTTGNSVTGLLYEEHELNVELDELLKDQFWNTPIMKKTVVPTLIRPFLMFKSIHNNLAFFYYVHNNTMVFTRVVMVIVAFLHLFIAGTILGLNHQYALSPTTYVFVAGVSINLISSILYLFTSRYLFASILFPLISVLSIGFLNVGTLLLPLREHLSPTINIVVVYLCVVMNLFPTIPFLVKVLVGLAFNLVTFVGYFVVVFVTDSFTLGDVVFIIICIFLTTIMLVCSYLLSYLVIRSFTMTIRSKIQNDNIAAQQKSNELLIQSAIPLQVVDRLSTKTLVFDNIEHGTVLFMYFKGYETFLVKEYKLAMTLLNDLFALMDGYVTLFQCNKIKSFGSKYLAVGGIHELDADAYQQQTHAIAIAMAAIYSMQACQKKLTQLIKLHPEFATELGNISIYMGLDAGPFVAGIVGKSKYLYDVYGDKVNTASRMASTTQPNTIQCTTYFQSLIESMVTTEFRGEIEVKGIGMMNTHFVHAHLSEDGLHQVANRLGIASHFFTTDYFVK